MRKIIYIFLFVSFLPFSSFTGGENEKIMVYTRVDGYYHEAIPTAVKAFFEMSRQQNWDLVVTKDADQFTKEKLQEFDAVVFLLTVGDILNAKQQEAFKSYIENGGSLVAIHTGTTTEKDWPWYQELIGATFIGHPPVQWAQMSIEDCNHPSVRHFKGDSLLWEDEWYSFNRNPRDSVHVIMSVNEDSYQFSKDSSKFAMGDHPIVWTNTSGNGLVFQSALGHMPELYNKESFRMHIIGAIKWAVNKSENSVEESK